MTRLDNIRFDVVSSVSFQYTNVAKSTYLVHQPIQHKRVLQTAPLKRQHLSAINKALKTL